MGDVCTGNPTQTIFATSTSQAAGAVSTSTSQSVSVGQGSVVTRSVQSGTEWVFTESSVGGGTATVPVEVPVTVSGEQQVFTVPISTLFAPCTSESTTSTSSTPTSTTPTSTSTPQTSTTPTSTRPETTETPESETSQTERSTRITSPTSTPPPASNANSTPVASPSSTPNNQPASSTSATGTLTTLSTAVPTTLSNGDQSMVVIVTTSSIAPSGALNGNDNSGNSGGGSSSNSGRAVAIGVGVAGGVIALIILIFGITWHIRRKRRNAMPLDDSEIWGPHHENKTPPPGVLPVNHGPGYTYNPYSEVRPAAYAPVPTMSPPRARPMVLAESDDNRLSAGSHGPAGLTAPLLSRAKTADEILYEAAREGLPKSRTSSATASHHTRPSETLSHRANQSYTASHKTHGSMASRTSGSAVGLLDHPPPPSTHGSLNQDAQRYQDLMDAPVAPERPMSPVSIAAPRLAIVNPDVDKDL